MTTVLTIAPLGGFDMSNWCGGWAKRQGGPVVKVPTAANLSKDAISDAAIELDKLIRSTPGDLIVFAHSQGCQVVGAWLDKYGLDQRVRDIARVRFVLTGNLERAFFGYAFNKPRWIPGGNIRGITRNNTFHEVLDIGRTGDLWANYPGGFWALLRLPFNRAHLDYSSVNPDDLKPVFRPKVVNGTTYFTVP